MRAAKGVTGTATRKYRNMKTHLHLHGGVANPRHSFGHGCGLRIALRANASFSSCSSTSSGLLYCSFAPQEAVSLPDLVLGLASGLVGALLAFWGWAEGFAAGLTA